MGLTLEPPTPLPAEGGDDQWWDWAKQGAVDQLLQEVHTTGECCQFPRPGDWPVGQQRGAPGRGGHGHHLPHDRHMHSRACRWRRGACELSLCELCALPLRGLLVWGCLHCSVEAGQYAASLQIPRCPSGRRALPSMLPHHNEGAVVWDPWIPSPMSVHTHSSRAVVPVLAVLLQGLRPPARRCL